MKKIVCLIEDLNSGGAERQLSGLAVLLQQNGYEVEVWTYYPGNFYLKNLIEANVAYRYIPEAQSKVKRIGVLYREIKKYNPDTVIAYLDTACIVSCIIKMFGLKFKLIVSERNTTQRLTKKAKLKFRLYQFADFIVPNSHTQTEFIKKNFPILVEKTECITNFVDTDKFIPNENKEKTKPIRILTVARVMTQKNVLNYIKAIKQVIDKGYNIKVDWYGSQSDDSYFSECNNLVKHLGLVDIFHFHNATRNILEEYQSSDIFCLPSIYEGYPNVVCEAMSCGLPIVCSDVCDNGKIVRNGENGYLFAPDNIDDISDNIIKLISDNNIMDMGQKSRELALTLFNKYCFVKKYIELINIEN